MSKDYYPRGYREDEEMYVYDQCCSNCARHDRDCPFEDYIGDENAPRAKKKSMKEDAVIKEQRLEWCINWKKRKGIRFLGGADERIRC